MIADFERGDTIDLSRIDASAAANGDQAFAYIGAKAFSGTAGELHYVKGVLSGDIDGDGRADFSIEVEVPALSTADLIL